MGLGNYKHCNALAIAACGCRHLTSAVWGSSECSSGLSIRCLLLFHVEAHNPFLRGFFVGIVIGVLEIDFASPELPRAAIERLNGRHVW